MSQPARLPQMKLGYATGSSIPAKWLCTGKAEDYYIRILMMIKSSKKQVLSVPSEY